MSASATRPVASPSPDPDRASPAAPAQTAFPHVGRLLGIVRQLVTYGTKLLNDLQRGVPTPHQVLATLTFGTKDLALIIARVKCGLLRAAGLEARLNLFVKRGRDLQPPPWRMPMPRVRKKVAEADAPEAAAPRSPVPTGVLALLPSAEEIAEQVRTRPLGAVLADICRDLGLPPGMMQGTLWQELKDAFVECGFSLVAFVRGDWRPMFGDPPELDDVPMDVKLALCELLAPVGQPP